ncbi:MAG TPA: hypothetical protein VMJ72_01270 [Candidatus Paceibacterota bacterium]|nr:hypothetical protein [Candidatus Paceibacterota bacterium]
MFIFRLTEPLCAHCPDRRNDGLMEWQWWFTEDGANHIELIIACRTCDARVRIPFSEMRARLHFGQPSPSDPSEQEEAPADGPPPSRRTVSHSRVFTKFDEVLFKKWGISTEGISIAP